MLSLFDAAILGLIEGITEYLPVSSTGHLIIASSLLGLDSPDRKGAVDAFNIVIQGGAILAVLGLYWPRVVAMLRGLLGRDVAGRRLFINLVIAFLPAAVFGLLLDDWIEAHLFHPGPVITALALGGVVMILLTPWQRRHFGAANDEDSADGAPSRYTTIDALTWRQALFIGLLQCVAMWPGTSRSMMTIVGGMFAGLRPKHAAEFSFLLGLPTLGGACVYKGAKNLLGDGPNMIDTLGAVPMLVGIAVATISAAIAVKWLVGFLSTHGVAAFGWYRLVLSGVLVVLIWQGRLHIAPDPAVPPAPDPIEVTS